MLFQEKLFLSGFSEMPPNEYSVGLFLRHLIKKMFLEKEKDKSTHWKLQLKNKIESLI